MKTLLTILSSAAALAAAAVASGFALDATVVLSVCAAAGIAGMFAADYSRPTGCRLDTVREPARRPVPVRRTEASPVFASLIVFNTTIA
jgi:hypothetical protein